MSDIIGEKKPEVSEDEVIGELEKEEGIARGDESLTDDEEEDEEDDDEFEDDEDEEPVE